MYEYINADNNSSKKSSKKNKGNNQNSVKKKNNNGKNADNNINTSNSKGKVGNTNKNNPQNSNLDIRQLCFETDKEIEEFRKKLADNSINAQSVKKVKPNFSYEWIQNLPININN